MIHLQIAQASNFGMRVDYDQELHDITDILIDHLNGLITDQGHDWETIEFNLDFVLAAWTCDCLHKGLGIGVNQCSIERHLANLTNPEIINLDSALALYLYAKWYESIPNAVAWNRMHRRSAAKTYVAPSRSAFFDLAQHQGTYHLVTGNLPRSVPAQLRSDTEQLVGKIQDTFQQAHWEYEAASELVEQAESLYRAWLAHAMRHAQVQFNEEAIATMIRGLNRYPERDRNGHDKASEYTPQLVEGYHILGYVTYLNARSALDTGEPQ